MIQDLPAVPICAIFNLIDWASFSGITIAVFAIGLKLMRAYLPKEYYILHLLS